MNFNFSIEKNQKLKMERGISFDEIIAAIENGGLLDTIEHPNSMKYPKQEIMVVAINDYVYLVPFVEEDSGSFFLKTIIPSRKVKKAYFEKMGKI
jgi:hypothetical protein